MKQFLLLFTLFLSPLISQAQSPKWTETEAVLIQKNRSIFEEHVLRHSTDSLNTIALDNYLLIPPTGALESKGEVMNSVTNLSVNKLLVLVSNTIMRDEMGILIGTLELEGTLGGKPLPKTIRYMSVFVLDKGKWRLQARTLTPVLQPK